jgi:uncharacterized protein (TIGR00251 family)
MKIRIRVKPNSRTVELNREGDSFVAKVKEPPKEDKANQAVIKLLAEHFGVPQSQVRILSGFRSRSKVVEVVGE